MGPKIEERLRVYPQEYTSYLEDQTLRLNTELEPEGKC
jgi:hypothetical protein